MRKAFLILFAILLTISGCSLKREVSIYDTYPATPGRLAIFQKDQSLPDNRIQIGTVTVGEKGFTPTKKCNYSACIEAIQEEAKKMGGQFIHIVSIKEPSVWGSTCYNIVADIYRYTE